MTATVNIGPRLGRSSSWEVSCDPAPLTLRRTGAWIGRWCSVSLIFCHKGHGDYRGHGERAGARSLGGRERTDRVRRSRSTSGRNSFGESGKDFGGTGSVRSASRRPRSPRCRERWTPTSRRREDGGVVPDLLVLVEERFDLLLESRHVMLSDVPHDICIDRVVAVNEAVSETHDLS